MTVGSSHCGFHWSATHTHEAYDRLSYLLPGARHGTQLNGIQMCLCDTHWYPSPFHFVEIAAPTTLKSFATWESLSAVGTARSTKWKGLGVPVRITEVHAVRECMRAHAHAHGLWLVGWLVAHRGVVDQHVVEAQVLAAGAAPILTRRKAPPHLPAPTHRAGHTHARMQPHACAALRVRHHAHA